MIKVRKENKEYRGLFDRKGLKEQMDRPNMHIYQHFTEEELMKVINSSFSENMPKERTNMLIAGKGGEKIFEEAIKKELSKWKI